MRHFPPPTLSSILSSSGVIDSVIPLDVVLGTCLADHDPHSPDSQRSSASIIRLNSSLPSFAPMPTKSRSSPRLPPFSLSSSYHYGERYLATRRDGLIKTVDRLKPLANSHLLSLLPPLTLSPVPFGIPFFLFLRLMSSRTQSFDVAVASRKFPLAAIHRSPSLAVLNQVPPPPAHTLISLLTCLGSKQRYLGLLSCTSCTSCHQRGRAARIRRQAGERGRRE